MSAPEGSGLHIALNDLPPEKAVERMMPKESPLARRQLAKLRVYPGADHPHAAQNPQTVNFKSMNRKNSRGA